MTKIEFIAALYEKLSGLPQDEVEERLEFYTEMIDERMEEGLSEEEAVAAAGSVDEIVSQILADVPLASLIREKVRPKRAMGAWEIVLLILGFPLWLPLLAAAFAVVLAVYAAIWSVVIALWAVEVSLAASVAGLVIAGVVSAVGGSLPAAMVIWGTALICAGLAIFGFFGCKAVGCAMVCLTKKVGLGIKRMFMRKERSA